MWKKVEAWSYFKNEGEERGLIVFYPEVGHYVIWEISRMLGTLIGVKYTLEEAQKELTYHLYKM